MNVVILTNHELLIASAVGSMRQIAALKADRLDSHGFDGVDGWTCHIEGACGELAVARLLGLYWNGSVNTFKTGDDVPGFQVRTRSRHDYELIVRHDDPDGSTYILVTGHAPRYVVRGCIIGQRAKQNQWLAEHGSRPAAFFVPQAELTPISALDVELLRAAS